MIFFALEKNLFYRILRKRTILSIKSIDLIMQIFRKFHRSKINKLCKDDKNYDIFTSPYCHGDEMNERKFSFF